MITEAKPTEGSKAMPTRVERRLEGDQLIMVCFFLLIVMLLLSLYPFERKY